MPPICPCDPSRLIRDNAPLHGSALLPLLEGSPTSQAQIHHRFQSWSPCLFTNNSRSVLCVCFAPALHPFRFASVLSPGGEAIATKRVEALSGWRLSLLGASNPMSSRVLWHERLGGACVFSSLRLCNSCSRSVAFCKAS